MNNHSPPRVVTIHHFDDQPEMVESLRNNMLAMVLLHRVDWIKDLPPVTKDSETPWQMTVAHPGVPTSVRYMFYRSSNDFVQRCKPENGDLVILDAYEIVPRTDAEYVARKCLDAVRDRVRKEHVFISSAYLSELPEDLREFIPRENLILRPFNVNDIAFLMLNLAGIPSLTEVDGVP